MQKPRALRRAEPLVAIPGVVGAISAGALWCYRVRGRAGGLVAVRRAERARDAELDAVVNIHRHIPNPPPCWKILENKGGFLISSSQRPKVH